MLDFVTKATTFLVLFDKLRAYEAHTKSGIPCCWARNAVSASHQSDAEGNAAGRRSAAYPVRGG